MPEVRLSEMSDRLEIEYPCRWVYKVIGADPHELRQAILEVVDVDDVTLEVSNTSSSGKYVSLNVEVAVQDETQRVGFYEALRQHVAVKMVL